MILVEESKSKLNTTGKEIDKDDGTEHKLLKNVDGDYLSKIDLEGVYWAYDAYHTVSIQSATERIEEGFLKT